MNSSTKKLIEAEKKALFLFQEIEKRGLIIPGKTEKNINTQIYNLAFELFNIKLYIQFNFNINLFIYIINVFIIK